MGEVELWIRMMQLVARRARACADELQGADEVSARETVARCARACADELRALRTRAGDEASTRGDDPERSHETGPPSE